MQTEPLISFAIPTYNFGRFIGDTIQSILSGCRQLAVTQFEIVVLDGGSTDNTADVLEDLQAKHENVRYLRNAERGGIDRDLNTVAEQARGRYIWLFSADDLLVPGWDENLVPLLGWSSDVYLVPALLCDFNMEPLRTNPIFRGYENAGPVKFEIRPDDDSVGKYLSAISTLEALFSFMTAVVVKRSTWNELAVREDYFGTCWAHCARLMPLFRQSSTVVYVNRNLIRKRGGNDSFLEKGFVNRIRIAVDGWTRLIDEFFPSAEHRRLLIRALRKDAPLVFFIYAKLSAKNREDVAKLQSMARQLYSDSNLSYSLKLRYAIFRHVPVSTTFTKIISPAMPFLARLRHKVISICS